MEVSFKGLLQKYLSQQYSSLEIEQLEQYLELLKRWNKKFNLTAIKEPEDIVVLHINDSLSVAPFISGEQIIDVGTGAGLPGIPLSIIFPDKQFTLLDSNGKKTRFLIQAKAALNLENVEIVKKRVEKYQPEQCFDCIITRAFAPLDRMLKQTRHLLCQHGRYLAMKADMSMQELGSLNSEDLIAQIKSLKISGCDHTRNLIILQNP